MLAFQTRVDWVIVDVHGSGLETDSAEGWTGKEGLSLEQGTKEELG